MILSHLHPHHSFSDVILLILFVPSVTLHDLCHLFLQSSSFIHSSHPQPIHGLRAFIFMLYLSTIVLVSTILWKHLLMCSALSSAWERFTRVILWDEHFFALTFQERIF